MYRKLLFQTWWRLAFSAILSFLFIGGRVIYGVGWEYREFPSLVDVLMMWVIFAVPIFLILTSISLYMCEKVLGWKRLSIVVASGIWFVSFLVTLISWSSLRGDDAVFMLLFSCSAFPIGILLVLGGRFTAKWVHAGFTDPAPINQSPTPELKSDYTSSSEENSAPHRTSISAGDYIPIGSKVAQTPDKGLNEPPAVAPVLERDKIIATPLAGPWRRFWARMIDIWLLQLTVASGLAIALTAFDPAWSSWFQKPGSELIFGWLSFPVVLLAEAIVFRVFDNTPGKALLALRVTTVGGTKLSFDDYLSRLLGVYWFGFGTGFPIVSLFTMHKQYQRLKLGREAYYDSGRFNVRGHPLGFFRIALAAVVVLLLLVMVPGILIELARRA